MRRDFRAEIEHFHGFAGGGAFGDFAGGAQSPPNGRRGRMFGTGELRLLVLKLLCEAPRHGYELIKAIEGLTGGVYAPSPGAIYPTLQLLVDEGAIKERQDGEDSRKAYCVTAVGTSEVVKRGAEVNALIERLGGVAEDLRNPSNLQINRAFKNLQSALRIRQHFGEMADDTVCAIVELIDETARRIERM